MEPPDRLRQRLRARRAALAPDLHKAAAAALCRRLIEQPAFARAQRIAAYLAVNGELDPTPLLAEAHRRGKSLWVPALANRRLRFAAWRPDVALQPNRFGIPEPADPDQRYLEPRQLDLVVVPLVAFDRRGNRVGMGGGYYDRSFSFMLDPATGARPLLIGAGYAFQEVNALTPSAWDVPLDAIVTEHEWISVEGR